MNAAPLRSVSRAVAPVMRNARHMSGDADHARAEMYKWKTMSKYAGLIIAGTAGLVFLSHAAGGHHHDDYVEMPFKIKSKVCI